MKFACLHGLATYPVCITCLGSSKPLQLQWVEIMHAVHFATTGFYFWLHFSLFFDERILQLLPFVSKLKTLKLYFHSRRDESFVPGVTFKDTKSFLKPIVHIVENSLLWYGRTTAVSTRHVCECTTCATMTFQSLSVHLMESTLCTGNRSVAADFWKNVAAMKCSPINQKHPEMWSF